MKRIVLVLIILGAFLSGCAPQYGEGEWAWEIVKSPITGRYYEVYGGRGVSEVTQVEYERYLEERR